MTASDHRRFAVTGGAGFIGSHLVDALLADARTSHVRVIDNFSSGRREHLAAHVADPRLEVVELDLVAGAGLSETFDGIDVVYHLAANPDARWGIANTRLDLEQETIATYNVLEAMRIARVPRVLLSSSGTVYGDVGTRTTVETLGPALPISLYGAGKVASEALVSAYCGTFGLSGVIFRFGNIVGERTTHGVIFDFIRKLARNDAELEVLGNGLQAKPYVYVRDLIGAMQHLETHGAGWAAGAFDVYNVAPPGATTVRYIAETLVAALGLAARTTIRYGSSDRGWAGDVAQSRMDSSKLAATGFTLPRGSDDAVATAIEAIVRWLGTRPPTDDLHLPTAVR